MRCSFRLSCLLDIMYVSVQIKCMHFIIYISWNGRNSILTVYLFLKISADDIFHCVCSNSLTIDTIYHEHWCLFSDRCNKPNGSNPWDEHLWKQYHLLNTSLNNYRCQSPLVDSQSKPYLFRCLIIMRCVQCVAPKHSDFKSYLIWIQSAICHTSKYCLTGEVNNSPTHRHVLVTSS